MGVYDFWTHGSSVQVEYPDRVKYIRRSGDGTIIRQEHGTWNWFHFPIPTPTIINNTKTKYDVVYLKARTGNKAIQSEPKEAFISEIGFLDIGKIEANYQLPSVAIVGENCSAEIFGISKKLPEKEVKNGLVICVRVEFKPDPDFDKTYPPQPVGEIIFFGAGARFKV
ncbi:MAG: hypothetical protein H3Z49_04560 [archaeon]|nr:hypothetical protein [archaeon]